ncbi:MAG: hypothetical protein PHW15_01525 [Patescibacteria group bacterium]|jgi:hypothetical protein|nr:hypothetical protein [Patescibacteria group bacterium]MDD5173051.1 hypothetical protein [Patescibacteria group bacterium]
MSSSFFPLKLYFIFFIVLFFSFFLSWWPHLQIDLFVHSEPLVTDFEINLDILAKNIIFNLNILPVKIVKIQEMENWPEYYFLNDLQEENLGEIMIFKKNDFEELIKFKIEEFNQSNFLNTGEAMRISKKVFKHQPEKWEIEVIKKDLLAGQGKLKVFVQEETIRDYDLEELKNKIKFKNIKEAKKELEKIYGIKKIEIKNYPRFWQQVPFFPSRIILRIIPANVSSTFN